MDLKENGWTQYYSFPLICLPHLVTALIPVETAGRKLDDDSWDRRTPVVEPMEDAFVVNTGQL